MWTLSKTEYRMKLADTMMRLGDNSNNCYALIDATNINYPILFCNEAYCQLTGYSEAELVGVSFKKFIQYASVDVFRLLDEKVSEGCISKFEVFYEKKGNQAFQAQIECFPLQNDEYQSEFIFIIVTDTTYKNLSKFGNDLERKMFRAIEREKTLFEKLTLSCQFIDTSMGPNIFSTIVMNIDGQMYITSAIPFEQSHTHLIPRGMANSYYKILMKLDDSKVFSRHKGYPLSSIHQQFAHDHDLHSCWQIPIPIYTGEVIGVITIFFKVQEKPREFYNKFIMKVITLIGLAYTYEMKQQQIYRLAYTDISTGLPNRHDFSRKLSDEKTGTIIIIQPSDFSKFVELYGRNFGDELLKQLANKLSKISAVNLVAQFSSSTLALYVSDQFDSETDLKHIFERVINEELTVFGNSIHIRLKIGVEKLSENISINTACKNAENALSNAKARGGTQIVYYNQQMQEDLKKELVILNELVEAINNKEFTAYVQPKIELYRGRVYGMEALARWHSPKLGVVSPADFIPIAEQAGLIREIDLQILQQILLWMQQRQYNGKKIVPVAINISPEHFYHTEFIDSLVSLLQQYYVDPHYIIIEVTESISLVDIERAQKILVRLRSLGFQTSVDDFGIGYSSLSYLQRLIFSELKIDRSFITKIDEQGTLTIVRSILQMTHSLEMTSVAEGIETKEQYELLKQFGCNVAQGYYFYKPMPLNVIDENEII